MEGGERGRHSLPYGESCGFWDDSARTASSVTPTGGPDVNLGPSTRAGRPAGDRRPGARAGGPESVVGPNTGPKGPSGNIGPGTGVYLARQPRPPSGKYLRETSSFTRTLRANYATLQDGARPRRIRGGTVL